MSIDGMAALNAQREKARASARRIPAPRHAPKPAQEPTPIGAQTVVPAPTVQEVEKKPVVAVTAQVKAVPTTAKPEPATDVSSAELKRSTIYFDQAADEWLEDVLILGRRSKPRTDASRSAVVRLAIERLRAEMRAEGVVAELRRRAAAAPATPGRKRL